MSKYATPGQYDPKKIIEAWNTSNTPEEVAKKFNMTKEQVTQLASQWRRKKIYMKSMRKGPASKMNIEELIEFSNKFKR